jgi:adiponectin receptor
VRHREGNFVQNVDKAGAGKSLGVHKENPPTTPQKLHFYHQLDPWQQDNHFIRSGYVKHTGSYMKCFQSLGYWHNETVNIYSHLLPSSILLLSVVYYINYQLTMYANYLGVWEKWNFIQFGVACTFCLFMSSTFHCVKSHSHKVSKFGNQLDYFGIIILITCSLISIVLFTYYDRPLYKYGMCGVFLVLGLICTVMTLNRKFATNHYRPIRSAMFILFGLSGVLPIVVGARIFGSDIIWDRASMGWLILEGVFYIGGAVLYAARFPERLTHVDEDEQTLLENPTVGKFDIIGHSHQIFHVLVVVAAFCHWQALVGCYHYLHQVTLPGLNG